MCGRFALFYTKDLVNRYRLTVAPTNLQSRYNIIPGQETLVILRQSPNQAVRMKWGMVPFWAKDKSIGYRMINARAETLTAKPSFRIPFQRQRCIVPANGFYEWKKVDDKNKIPYFVHTKSTKILSLAGLYDVWKSNENDILKTFTIITVRPNQRLASIHDRMPAILKEEEESIWLDKNISDTNTLLPLLKPSEDENLKAYPVNQAVNDPNNDDESLIEPYGLGTMI